MLHDQNEEAKRKTEFCKQKVIKRFVKMEIKSSVNLDALKSELHNISCPNHELEI